MRKRYRIMAAVFLAAGLFSGCGGSKDPESTQVIQLTITPEATPTPELSQVNPDAVVTNGSLTMINEYTADHGTPAAETEQEPVPEEETSDEES